jgi:hypothetical protein
MIQTSSVLKFSGKHPKARGLSAKDTLSSSLGHRSTCVELPGHPDATSCSPPPASWRREGSPGDPLATPRDGPPPLFFSLAPSFFPVLPPSDLQAAPWPPPSTTVPCSPQPRRHPEKVRRTVLYFPAEGIEPPCPQPPPESSFPRRKPRSAAAKFATAGRPLAKLTPPASPR